MSLNSDLNRTAEQLISEINSLLDQINAQKGGEISLISELNNLLSESQGTDINLTEQDAVALAEQQGGKRKKKRSKSKKSRKSKSKKSRKSKSKKSRTKSKSKKSRTKSKSKKSRTKSKSKRKLRRETDSEQQGGDEKKKRKPNKAFMDMVALKKWLREDKLPNENLNYILMGKPVSILYNANNKSVEKSKKNFDKVKFMKDYKEAEKNKKSKKSN